MSDDLDEIVDNLREPTSWIRVLFMLGFVAVLYLVIAPIVLVLAIVQAMFSLLTGESNYNLRRFGKAMAEYVQQILHYLSFNSHDKPFPFADFPDLGEDEQNDSDESGNSEEATPAAKKAPRKAAKKTTAKKKSAAKKKTKSEGADKKADDAKPSADAPESD